MYSVDGHDGREHHEQERNDESAFHDYRDYDHPPFLAGRLGFSRAVAAASNHG